MKSFTINAFVILAAVAFVSVSATEYDLKTKLPGRIVGGEAAVRGDFPSMVQVRSGLGHWCGGTIINANWVVTAGHCSENVQNFNVVAGELDLDVDEGYEQVRNVDRIVFHPNYNSASLANDIALLHISTPFTFNADVQPVLWAPPGFLPARNVTTAGWGNLNEGGPGSTRLMKVQVPIVGIWDCREAYGEQAVINGMICAGAGGKDSCNGDSGGPLMSGNVLVGLVSWGWGCARPGYPGVYTEVAYFANWIQSTIES